MYTCIINFRKNSPPLSLPPLPPLSLSLSLSLSLIVYFPSFFYSLPSINNQSKTQYSENPANNILAGIPSPWRGNFPSNSNWTVYGTPNNYQTIGSRHYSHTRLWWWMKSQVHQQRDPFHSFPCVEKKSKT